MRSCYRSKWRLTRRSDRLRDGFYYFVSPETPFYPGFHQLGSRIWTSDEREAQEPLGEWNGRQQWYRGDPPARRPLPVLVGTPDCIANGENPGLPIIPDVSAACAKILPPLCYAAEDDLLAATNVYDCVFAKKSADILTDAYIDLPTAMLAVEALLPDATVTSFPQPTPLTPAGVIAVQGTTAVLWLTGTTTEEQLAVQGFYFGLGPINQGLYSASVIYENAALLIADQLNMAGAGTALRIVLVGHSYGGAVEMVLAAKMLIANPGRNVELLTLGAPQPGDHRLIDLIEGLRQTHYCNERDPVPFLPPKGITLAALFLDLVAGLGFLWATFARPPRVTVITQDGQLQALDTEDAPDDLIYIAGLLIAQVRELPRFKDHSTDWYSYYLCKACSCVPRPCIAPGEQDIGFEAAIDDFEYVFDAVPAVVNVPRVALTVTARYPSGKARSWEYHPPASQGVFIEALVDAFDNYTGFEFFYEPFPVDPSFLCQWNFTADEMYMGINTIDFPDVFHMLLPGDGVVTLGGLHIYPTLV